MPVIVSIREDDEEKATFVTDNVLHGHFDLLKKIEDKSCELYELIKEYQSVTYKQVDEFNFVELEFD